MDEQRKEAKEMAKKLPFNKKIEHIWLYYKWWIISTIVVIALIVGTVYDVVTRPSYDMEMALYTEKYVNDERIAALEEYLSPFAPDLDGDGVQTVKVYAVSSAMVGMEESAAVQTKLSAELLTGEYPVFLVDQTYYDLLQLEGYQGAIESYREMNAIPELCEIFHLQDGETMYWGTAIPYDDEAIPNHDIATEMEIQLFGERE